MPKRHKVTLQDIAAWSNINEAFRLAVRGKQQRPEVLDFCRDLETNLQTVQKAILRGELVYGEYREFPIFDPKYRIIHAAPFADRIIHHALIQKTGPILERSWVDSSYACREDKGSHKAILQAAKLAKRYPVMVKPDVSAYFKQVHHQTLMTLLQRKLRDTDIFQLLHHLLTSFSASGVGLPIGALTSQYFANHYLDGFQRWLNSQTDVKAELRYMDDVLLFCDTKTDARNIIRLAQAWLSDNRFLSLKPAIAQFSHTGLTFCGFKISRAGFAPGKRRKNNLKQRIRRLMQQLEENGVSVNELQRQGEVLKALLVPGNHRQWLLQHTPLNRIERQ